MRKLITLGLTFSLFTLALSFGPAIGGTPAQDNAGTELQYAAKFICGRTDGGIAAPGQYYTIVNVHNPSPDRTVEFRKKFARSLPDEQTGKITQFFQATLQADEAMGIDCPNIYKHTGITPDTFIEGYVVIHTPTELDVVSVYTAGASGVATLHTERVSPRRVPIVPLACADLNLSLSTGAAAWRITTNPAGGNVPSPASLVASTGWPPLTGAQWIGPNATGAGVAGDYVYETCFCLCSGFTNASLTLTGLADNSANVYLNGTAAPTSIGGYNSPYPVQFTDQQLFKVGTNCLSVVVNNLGGPTALAISGTVTATAGSCPTNQTGGPGSLKPSPTPAPTPTPGRRP